MILCVCACELFPVHHASKHKYPIAPPTSSSKFRQNIQIINLHLKKLQNNFVSISTRIPGEIVRFNELCDSMVAVIVMLNLVNRSVFLFN